MRRLKIYIVEQLIKDVCSNLYFYINNRILAKNKKDAVQRCCDSLKIKKEDIGRVYLYRGE